MRSRIVLAALALLLGGALPALAAAPFGDLTAPSGRGNHGAASGSMPYTGWALDDNGVAAVDILVDGEVVIRAVYGVRRPKVSRKFPGFPDSARPGFEGFLDTSRFRNGIHEVSAIVTSKSGEVVQLQVRRINFQNANHILAPFGENTFPNDDAAMHGRCSADPTRRFSVVKGWAMDAGQSGENPHKAGIAWVEILIDGAILFNTKNHCTFNPASGGLTNCYGLPSRDLTYVYPTYRDSDRATYRFAIDVGALILAGFYNRGSHRITIRAGDFDDNVRNIDSFVTKWHCDEDIANEKALGRIEEPNTTQPWSDTITVRGWALDFNGVLAVEIKVNGILIGTATLGGPRPDVADCYPGYPQSASAGFTFALDTTQFLNGPATLEIWVRDNSGDETLIGEGLFVIDN